MVRKNVHGILLLFNHESDCECSIIIILDFLRKPLVILRERKIAHISGICNVRFKKLVAGAQKRSNKKLKEHVQ